MRWGTALFPTEVLAFRLMPNVGGHIQGRWSLGILAATGCSERLPLPPLRCCDPASMRPVCRATRLDISH